MNPSSKGKSETIKSWIKIKNTFSQPSVVKDFLYIKLQELTIKGKTDE